ncbi:MAG: DUF6115 domain-containing protein [Peptococcaceae bacterium]
MINFFAGIITAIFIMWLLARSFKKNLQEDLAEAKHIRADLEKLYQEYLKVSEEITRNLAAGIKENQEIIEENNTFEAGGFPDYHNEKEEYSKNNNTAVIKKNVVRKPGSLRQQDIVELSEAGYSVKEISERFGVEQDQVSMVLQLYRN